MTITIIRKSKTAPPPIPDPIEIDEPIVAEPVNIDAKPMTLGEVVAAIKSFDALTIQKRNGLISACRSTGRLAGRSLKDISADASNLREIFVSAFPATIGMNQKRFNNVRSEVARACVLAKAWTPMSWNEDPSPAWHILLGQAKQDYQRWTLAVFARSCSALGVEPPSVSNELLDQFEHILGRQMVAGNPALTRRRIAKAFNKVVKDNDLKAYPRLVANATPSYVTPPLTVYPLSLQEDIAAFLERAAVSDRFEDYDEGGGFYRPVTVRNNRNQLRQILDAAVLSGVPKEALTGLSILLDKAVWSRAFEVIRKRIGKQFPTSLTNITRMLLVIARHYVHAPAGQIKSLQTALKAISKGNGLAVRQMGDRSKTVMKQFDDPRNVAAVVQLPEALLKGASKTRRKGDGALDAMIAAAITVLFNSPLRMENVASLSFGDNFQLEALKGGKVRYEINIASQDTKNLVQMDGEIEGDDAKLIATYVEKYRPLLFSGPTDALFPGSNGKPRDPGKLGQHISRRIIKHTGLKMNPHCFRHLAAKIFLDDHPGDYEEVRRILGHRTVKTTIAFYSPAETKSAQKKYHASLAKFKGGQ